MTDSEKLQAIIATAIEQGWLYVMTDATSEYIANRLMEQGWEYNYLFNHEFAKAYWGEETLSPLYADLENLSQPDYAWEYHLQQCVIAENPIEYYYDNK